MLLWCTNDGNRTERKEEICLAVKLYKFFTGLIETVVILLAAAMLLPQLFGVKCFAVTSASMTPTYPVGCIVYAVPTDPEMIEPGDVISFSMGSVTATHRVIAVDRTEEAFTTQGDANNTPDGAPVAYSRVIGKVMFSIPLLGYLTVWLTPKRIILVLIAVATLMLLPIGSGKGKQDKA